MTLDNMIYQVLIRCKHTATAVSLDQPTAKQLVNKALQFYYPIALRADQTFYTKSVTIAQASQTTNEGTFDLPTDFYKGLLVEVSGAKEGAARILGHREYINVANNPFQGGTAANPVCRIDTTVLKLRPQSVMSVTLHYIWTFQFIDDETTEITDPGNGHFAIIPWTFEQPVILEAVRLARLRHNLLVDNPSDVSKGLQTLSDAINAIRDANTPLRLYGAEIPT